MEAELSIIIVNWNGEKFLLQCLKSIIENPPTIPYEIIVVDNASTDESVKYLKSKEARGLLKNTNFTLIESKENLGFSRANNIAIERTNTLYVFLLNPDTIIKPKAIDRLLETLKSDAEIGAVAPKLFNADGTLQYNVWRFPPTPISLIVEGLKLYRIMPKKGIGSWLYSSHWSYTERKAVPMFSGAAIMAKREMINSIGAFDEDFYMYGEDGEWCIRMNRNGWKTFFEPKAEIVHFGGQSALQRWGSEESRLKEEAAFIFFQKKCLPKTLLCANLIARIFILSTYYVKNTIFGKENPMIVPLIKLQIASLKSIL